MEDRRKHNRIKKNVESEVHTDEGSTFSTSQDMSQGGIYISTPELIKEGSIVELSFGVQGEEPVKLKGIVRWIKSEEDDEKKAGMGIEFIDVTEDQQVIINKIIS
jgi:uncharacterized protein (TIGR02266 family)